MGRFTAVLFSGLLIGMLASQAHSATLTEAEALEAARTASSTLMKRLGARLKAAMADGGPMAALDICHLQAQPLTNATSRDLQLHVGRTAQKVRNPANAPDVWEAEQLAGFVAALETGAPAADLEILERVNAVEGGHQWRYMAPIMTAPVCLNCHGDNLQPALADAIAARYPADQATGFKVGDLRGAFTVRISE